MGDELVETSGLSETEAALRIKELQLVFGILKKKG